MPQVKVAIPASIERTLRGIAADYEITFSDIVTEALEWVLDQEEEFIEDLQESLGFEETEEAPSGEEEEPEDREMEE